MSEPLKKGAGLTYMLMMTFFSLVLAGYSTFIPPVRHFLEAQFEMGDLKESLDEMQNSLKKVESEIGEMKRLISELNGNEEAV